jgi:hypothetical protein
MSHANNNYFIQDCATQIINISCMIVHTNNKIFIQVWVTTINKYFMYDRSHNWLDYTIIGLHNNWITQIIGLHK